MLIERIEIRLLDLPLVTPFRAAHGTTTTREIVVVRLETDLGHGWGECAALPEPTYSDEFAAGAFVILDEELAPRLLGHRLDALDISRRLAMVRGAPMAIAALEMAALDVELRTAGQPLAQWLGDPVARVDSGAAVGLGPTGQVVDEVEKLVTEGIRRVKLKIEPGHDHEVVEAVRDRVAGVEIQVDGNGSFGGEHVDALVGLAGTGVTAIEQPFAPGDVSSAARLVAGCDVPIVADEAAGSADEVRRLHRDGALSAVSIKAPRLGGLVAARRLHDQCLGDHLPVTAGGMLETGLGRHALAALAALPGFSLTGDLSPARRWLAADPWPDLDLAGGQIRVPTTPGVAPDPDYEIIERYTVMSTELSL